MPERMKNEDNINRKKQEAPITDHLQANDEPELVTTLETKFVSILGAGAPGTDVFYRKKKFITDVARILACDGYASDTSPVIEILYWYPEDALTVDIADFYSVNPISSLLYRIMARVNDGTTMDDFMNTRRFAASSAEYDTDELELFILPKQVVIQVMHHGPFANEFGTLERLGAAANGHGVNRSGPHHEIHLDPFTRSTPQDMLRTILRDPVT